MISSQVVTYTYYSFYNNVEFIFGKKEIIIHCENLHFYNINLHFYRITEL